MPKVSHAAHEVMRLNRGSGGRIAGKSSAVEITATATGPPERTAPLKRKSLNSNRAFTS